MSEKSNGSDQSPDSSAPLEKIDSPGRTPSEETLRGNGNGNSEGNQQQNGQGNGHRVRFRSSREFQYQEPRSPGPQDEKEERQKARKEGQPHGPHMPYSHESDVTDTPLNERTQQGDQAQDQEQEKGLEKVISPVEEKAKSARDRLLDAGSSFKEKTRRLAAKLGRPMEGGDDLQAAVYHPDWGSGGRVPESDVTDNKNKTDDQKRQHQKEPGGEAHRLVREMSQDQSAKRRNTRGKPYPHEGKNDKEGQNEANLESGLRYRSSGGGILSQLLKLNNAQTGGTQGEGRSSSVSSSDSGTAPGSGTTTPSKKQKPKWYKKPPNTSTSTLVSGQNTPVSSEDLSWAQRRRGGGKGQKSKQRLEDEIRVTVHIAEIIARQRYIMQLCKALMQFGAPTHRLEEYCQMTAKVLEVDSQYLYFPGCMIMSFDDPSTRTTEVKLVRCAQGIDLGRLADTHDVYKNVVHDIYGVEEAVQELNDIMNRKKRFNKWIVVFTYGLASATVGPFAFDARPIDMPVIFINGCLLGFMQHILAANSVLYSNVFEVTASILTSFLARAFGSIPRVVNGKRQFIFCFSAIAQASIALILPGFLVLCSSLELQSHQIIAGSIRIVYAIIYSLFLGYGITVGITIYGLMDAHATSETQCTSVPYFSNPYIQKFPFVPIMCVWLVVINQGKWKQLPVMMFIAMSGWTTNYFSTNRLGSNSQVANTVGAFTIGVLGNLYSRLWHGHAATAILPGIFVLVPSGLAATGSLISGVESANEIRTNISAPGGGPGAKKPGAGLPSSSSLFSLAIGMVQVAIGITIGLFLAALIVYPYGKRRSGLFSF